MGGPRLVDDQQHIAGVGYLREPPDVGDGAEIAGGHHIGSDRLRVGVQGSGEGFGTQPVGSADIGVNVGLNVVADETAEDHSIHHAGVHAALHYDMLAKVAKCQAGDEVSFRCAVGHQPGAAGPPRLGSEPSGLLQCRGRGPLIDTVHQRRQIEFQHPFTEQLGKLRLGQRRPGVARHIQAHVVDVGVPADSVRVGRLRLRGVDRATAVHTDLLGCDLFAHLTHPWRRANLCGTCGPQQKRRLGAPTTQRRNPRAVSNMSATLTDHVASRRGYREEVKILSTAAPVAEPR